MDALESNGNPETPTLHGKHEHFSEVQQVRGELEQFLRSTLDAMAQPIALLDQRGIVLITNRTWEHSGDPAGPLCGSAVGTNYLLFLSSSRRRQDSDERFVAAGLRSVLEARARSFVLEYPRVSRSRERWYRVRITRIPGSAPARVVVVHEDITERMQFERELKRQALYDAETDLPNRALFLNRLEHALRRAEDKPNIAVMLLDIDNLKLVNETYGHDTGDQLIREFSLRLKQSIKRREMLARFVGDKFTIMVEDMKHPEDAAGLVHRVKEGLRAPFKIGSNEVFLSASIGVAFGSSGSRAEELVRAADTALYRAKLNGAGNGAVEVFEPSMHTGVSRRLVLESDLRRAIERQEFVLYYQPIIDVHSGSIVAAEALVRWRHPQRCLLLPGAFIAVAEETGLIVPLGRWALNEACRQLFHWIQRRDLSPGFRVSVNVSARQVYEPDVVLEVATVLRDTGVDPGGLQLEMTESTMMSDARGTVKVLQELRSLGLQLAVDDFGTGYSSLAQLQRLPVNILKVDRSFVRGLPGDGRNRAIVESVVSLARGLGLAVTCEGVETAEQLETMRSMGCNRVQGFLFSPPVPSHQFENLVSQGKRW